LEFKGRVWKFGSNIDTDVIIPARYLTRFDQATMASHCLEGVDPDFSSKCRKGDILVAEWNFGCGSSREHAPIAIAGAGISCILAKSFARIFYRNGFNMGLPLLEVAEDEIDGIQTGDVLEVDLAKGVVRNHTRGVRFPLQPLPDFMQELLADGGLIPHVRRKLIAAGRIRPPV
jgi:3-isopropylmalate/(R)-2-methylmalate dehydratase small subunit